jgi:hypothetical protein
MEARGRARVLYDVVVAKQAVVNEKLLAALARYDAQGYDLQLLTADGWAIVRRRDDWVSLRLVDGNVLTGAWAPVRSPWDRLVRRFALLLVPVVILGSAAVAASLVGRANSGESPPPAVPSATRTLPPATPQILSGGVPRSGFGLFVFGGGTEAQMIAASGCPAETSAFWATNSAGQFVVFVPGADVSVVNDPWRTQFRTGIPSGTPLLGECAAPAPLDPILEAPGSVFATPTPTSTPTP